MNDRIKELEWILDRQISGFHQYCLDEPIHVSVVSQNLCEMLELEKAELLAENEDRYARMVHPADRDRYEEWLRQVSQKKKTKSLEYRILRNNGTIIWVRDTMTIERREDGTLVGYSVLADITADRKDEKGLQIFQESSPLGVLRYTCEKQPRLTYINSRMMELLQLSEDMRELELYRDNIYLMIPLEEHHRFSDYLSRVYTADTPLAGEMTLQRRNGTRIYVFGWVTRSVNEYGEEEFQSVCMDMTRRHDIRKQAETKRYLKALTEVYDKIFEFQVNSNLIKCLHCETGSSFKQLEGIAMQLDDVLEKWLLDAVEEADRERMRSFFLDACRRRLQEPDDKPLQIRYQARSGNGEVKPYRGNFIKIDDSTSFYCCRQMKEMEETTVLRQENDHLKESMKELVMSFSDGLAAFELSAEGMVRPLYASENVSEFFGYTREEWLPLTEQFTPLWDFVAQSEVPLEQFEKLLRDGEAEFGYFDYKTETERRIKAICSQKEPSSHSARYVMLYSMEDAGQGAKEGALESKAVFIRTFGYFDVFVGEQPIAFRNKKSKELLALLVDRKGGYVTSEEAIAFLWEEEPVSPVTLSRYRKVALRLKNTLEEYGISHIVEVTDGKRRIVQEHVQCDLYRYLSGKDEYSQLFKGSYLTNYSWAETTLGELFNDQ